MSSTLRSLESSSFTNLMAFRSLPKGRKSSIQVVISFRVPSLLDIFAVNNKSLEKWCDFSYCGVIVTQHESSIITISREARVSLNFDSDSSPRLSEERDR